MEIVPVSEKFNMFIDVLPVNAVDNMYIKLCTAYNSEVKSVIQMVPPEVTRIEADLLLQQHLA